MIHFLPGSMTKHTGFVVVANNKPSAITCRGTVRLTIANYITGKELHWELFHVLVVPNLSKSDSYVVVNRLQCSDTT